MIVATTVVDGIATILLDRPEVRNAVDGPTALALEQAVVAAGDDDDVAAIVLAGAGDTFCAGADLHALLDDPARRNRMVAELRGPMGPTRMASPVPVIAAIEGHAVAGGLELALWADLRVMARDAVVGVFCRRWGVPLVDGGTVRLPRLIGMSRALDLVLTGRPVDADEALAIGLVNRVCPPGRAVAVATELAAAISAFPAPAMLADRAGVHAAFDARIEDALLAEHHRGMEVVEAGGMVAVARFTAGEGRGGAFD